MKFKVFISEDPLLEIFNDERSDYVTKTFESMSDAVELTMSMALEYKFHTALMTIEE